MNSTELFENDALIEIVSKAVNKSIPAIMSHMSRGKWHMSKVMISQVDEKSIHVEIAPREKPLPINIQVDQPVGLTFKMDFNKFICQTAVSGFAPSVNPDCGGRLILELPEKLEKMQKRSYFRVKTPACYTIKSLLWHRSYNDERVSNPKEDYWEGQLVDVSAGGLQIAVNKNKMPNFKSGQVIGFQFTPLPYQKPLVLEGQLRHMEETADGKNICMGIQIVGLETTQEGRDKLRRLIDIVETYHLINENKLEPEKVTEV